MAARQGVQAATEFQKVIDHRGNVMNDPVGALAHLGLARAYAMQGDTTKAKAAYQMEGVSAHEKLLTQPGGRHLFRLFG